MVAGGGAEDPVSHLASLADPSLDDLVEAVIAWTHLVMGESEIVEACGRFYADNGKVFPDDPFYDTRMSYFFDVFVFERPLASPRAAEYGLASATPYELFIAHVRDPARGVPPAVVERLARLGGFRHALFQIVKLQERTMVVQDLTRPERARHVVTARAGDTFRGLEKKAIFQGFLFPIGDVDQLSHGLVLHPQRANRIIRRFVRLGQKGENFSRRIALAKLANVQIRHLRHRHVDPKIIYQTDLK